MSENIFAGTLRSAISASGLSLDRVQARLAARGISVSVTALSYWQSGKRQPERASSISAIRALEQVLELPSGALLALLPPPRPRGATSRRKHQETDFSQQVLQPMLDRIGAPGSLDQQIRLVSLHDRCDVGTNGQVVSARAVMQATADGQDRWLLVYDRSAPELTGLRNCHLGRLVVDAEHGVTVAELLFDRPVDRGETQLIEYSISTDEPAESHFREFRRPVREYLLEVHFAAARRPSKCWQYTRENTSESPARRELKMDADNGVHAVTLDFGPGAFGILWN